MRAFNPDNVVKPASNYVQAVVHRAAAEFLVEIEAEAIKE